MSDAGGAGRRRPPGRRRAGTRAFASLLLLLAPVSAGCWIEPAPSANGGDADTISLEASVREMMDAAGDAWNRGDLAAFMSDYQRSPESTYIGGVGLVRGWEGIRARYAPVFAPGAERDSLRFELLDTREIEQLHALALVRYVLYESVPDSATAADSAGAEGSAGGRGSAGGAGTAGDGAARTEGGPGAPDSAGRAVAPDDGADRRVVSTGLVTLVLLRVEGRWEIVHDHSSADAPPDSSDGAASESADAAGSS